MLMEKLSISKLNAIPEQISHVIIGENKRSLIITFSNTTARSDIAKFIHNFHILLLHQGEIISYFSTSFLVCNKKLLNEKNQLSVDLNVTNDIQKDDIVGVHIFEEKPNLFELL